MIRVLVVSSSAVVRAGLEAIVHEHPALSLVGTAEGVQDLFGQVESARPEVILVEGSLSEDGLLTALTGSGEELLLAGAPGIVVLADDLPVAWIADALRAGVKAMLPRHASPAEIVTAAEAAAVGLTALRSGTINLLLTELSEGPASELSRRQSGIGSKDAVTEPLTPRESQILGMLAQGLGNKEIAWQLKISEHTVKFHLASIFGKLGVSTRTEAVTQGLRLGLILL